MDTATKLAPAKGDVDEHALHAMSHELISPVVQRWIDEGSEDPEGFWGRAAEQLPWFRKWDRVLDWTPPTFNWFVGGQTNLAYNALDYHVKRGRGGHTALIYSRIRENRLDPSWTDFKRSQNQQAVMQATLAKLASPMRFFSLPFDGSDLLAPMRTVASIRIMASGLVGM